MKIGYWTARPATLWNIVLPGMLFVTFQLLLGISQFVTARTSRHQNLEFLHFAVVDSHSIKCLFAKKNSSTASHSITVFNSRSYHAHRNEADKACIFLPINKLVTLSSLVGNLDPTKRRLGNSSNLGFKGLIPLKSAIAAHEIQTGVVEAKALFDNRLIVSIDPGLKNLAGITFAIGELNTTEPEKSKF